MTDSNDEYTKARNTAAEASVNRNLLELNEADGRVRHFKAGSDWGYERGKAESIAEAFKDVPLDIRQCAVVSDAFEKWNDMRQQLEAANALIEMLVKTLEEAGRMLHMQASSMTIIDATLARVEEWRLENSPRSGTKNE